MSQFTRLGLVGRRDNPGVTESLQTVVEFAAANQLEIVLETFTATILADGQTAGVPVVARDELGDHCDLLVVVGGDGSLLGVGRELAHAKVPVVGVNRGGLGFLAAIPPDQIETQLAQVLAGDFLVEKRFLLDACIVRDGVELPGSNALNDLSLIHI